jgi:hypothetical protein
MPSRRLIAAFALVAALADAAVVDRIAALVGRTVITDSMVRRALRVQAMLAREPLAETPANWEKTRARLIEQALIRDEIEVSRYPKAQPDEVRAALSQVREQFGGPGPFVNVLNNYLIDERDLSEILGWQITFGRFLAYRFRPAVQIADADLRKFYDTWKPAGLKPSFEEARERIESEYIIAESDRMLDRWLRETRLRTRIETYELPGAAGGTP